MTCIGSMCAGLALSVAVACGATAAAADVKVSSARLGVTVLRELGPQFERDTGGHLNVTEIYDPQFMKRLKAGAPIDTDVVILRYDLIDALINAGKLRGATRTNLFKTGEGVEARAGAPKPDVSTVERFRQALPDAKSIAYLADGLETPYLDRLMERLGIANQIKAKLIRPDEDLVSIMTARGEVELDIAITTQIMTTPGVELAGPLPPDIQSYLQLCRCGHHQLQSAGGGWEVAPVSHRAGRNPGTPCARDGARVIKSASLLQAS